MPKVSKEFLAAVVTGFIIGVGILGVTYLELKMNESEEDRLHRKQVNDLEAKGKLATAKLVNRVGEVKGEGGYYELVFTKLPRRIPPTGQS